MVILKELKRNKLTQMSPMKGLKNILKKFKNILI